MTTYAKRSTILHSDREWSSRPNAWTVGPTETLSGKLVITWPMGYDASSHDVLLPQPWLADALSDLRYLLTLPEGWDSYGASRVDGRSADRAYAVLRDLAMSDAPRPQIAPTSVGGLRLEWYSPSLELQLSIEPDEDGLLLFFRDAVTEATWEGSVGDEPEPFEKLLWRVTAHE